MLRTLVYFLALTCLLTEGIDVNLLDNNDVKVQLKDNPSAGLSIILERKNIRQVIAVIGRHAGAIQQTQTDGDIIMEYSNGTRVTVSSKEVPNGYLITISWMAGRNRLEDCVNLGDHHWYGGPEQKRQFWPIEKLLLQSYSYVTKEADNCAVAEPYWLSSDGIFFYFDKKVPLFVDQNIIGKNAACFYAEVKPPYSKKRETNELVYALGIFDNPRTAHEFAVEKYLNKPSGIPDQGMLTYPVWSTWARYKRNINHDVVLQFANEIVNNGFKSSHIEIDDLWEVCYGSQTVDIRKFPDMRNTISNLKELGFRVALWTHPFINKDCEPWNSEALEKGFLVLSERGSPETSWWNDNATSTAHVDFTNPTARSWYADRLKALQAEYGIDSFKFDAGETSWAPQIPVLNGDINDQPGVLTADYVRTVAQFGPLVEVRTGYRTQDLPVFLRMIDKDSYWTFENGLPTVITTLLQLNMNGYPFVLPDMIGGNGYNESPSKELFIRWLQATTFMPSLQFSYVPWDFDNETIEITRKYVDLHEAFSPILIEACQKAVSDGSPVNPPIWWIDPTNKEAYDIWDQYLLGETILVAPVLEHRANKRDVYLPRGKWQAQGDPNNIYEGGDWIRGYPATLDTLPYFVKV